jgi:hypothetical protein
MMACDEGSCRILSQSARRGRSPVVGGWLVVRKIADGTTVPARRDAVSRQISSQFSAITRVLVRFRASPLSASQWTWPSIIAQYLPFRMDRPGRAGRVEG